MLVVQCVPVALRTSSDSFVIDQSETPLNWDEDREMLLSRR